MDIAELWRIYWPTWTKAGTTAGIVLITLLMFPALVGCITKKLEKRRFTAMLFLLIWLYWVFASCVFYRSGYAEYHYILKPFWSYELAFGRGSRIMLQEILLNCCLLLPVGFLFPVAFDLKKPAITILFGFLCSAGIETMQLVMKKGLFEWDDMLHNTLGVVAGYGLYRIGSLIFHKALHHRKKRKIQKLGIKITPPAA
ncbi:MAG: VanZ family protein [Lachnospiraceae bacterium]|nr:VanZ family protein [Lachnospiraceae bacterium]